MRLFGRDQRVPEQHLGAGTSLPVAAVDGQLPSLVRWDRDTRRVLELVQPALRTLRAAGLTGEVELGTAPVEGAHRVEVRRRDREPIALLVEEHEGFTLLPWWEERDDRAAPGHRPFVETVEPVDTHTALDELVCAFSSLVAHEAEALDAGPDGVPTGVPDALPGGLTVFDGALMLLRSDGGRPRRWCARVFITRHHHEAGAGGTDQSRWSVENTVGVKLHLDGTVADDPDDGPRSAEETRDALVTAAGWAGEPVDVMPYVRWLVARTEDHLGLSITDP